MEGETMIEAKLPFKSVYICEVCGNQSLDRSEIEKCESVKTWETPDIAIGDTVKMFGRLCNERGFAGISPDPHEETVYDLFYKNPQTFRLSDPMVHAEPKPHQLCVELRCEPFQKRGWRKGDTAVGKSFMTYEQFLLWREGDRGKLEWAGLLPREALLIAYESGRKRFASVVFISFIALVVAGLGTLLWFIS